MTTPNKKTAHQRSPHFNQSIFTLKVEGKPASKPIKSKREDIERMKKRKRIEEMELAKSLGISERDFI